MNKLLRFTLFFFLLFASDQITRAQSTLIHYWDFNNLTVTYHVPNVPYFKADYSILDTNAAYLEYYLIPGTSDAYAGYVDNYTPGPDAEGVVLDTANIRNNAGTGQAFRARNPVDSVELRWHIPTTGYSNIVLKYDLESSSTTSGDSTQHFSYSDDGGVTWKTTGIMVDGVSTDTLNTTPAAYTGDTAWGLVTIALTDPSVNNNSNLIFRIIATGNAHKTGGNLRYDNVTVDGEPMNQGLALIHYWDFNNLTQTYHVPDVPNFKADYSTIDTNTAFLQYYLIPGTSNSYAGFVDNYTPGPDAEGVVLDTANIRIGAGIGQAFRARNPVNSVELRWHIPTTGYSNIVIKYDLESSSTTSGDSTQNFSYSPDGGTTWSTAGITVDGISTDTLNTTPAAYAGDTAWGLVTIRLTDPSVNNNANLIFRIIATGNAHKTSGNLRYDNVTVEGTGASKPPPAQIAVTSPIQGNILVPGTMDTIKFTTINELGQMRTITFSPDGGTTWQPVGTVTGATSYVWMVPNTATYNGLIRVTDSANVTGTSKAFVIYPITYSNRIIHYWDFNTWSSGAYHNPNIPSIRSDFSATSTPGSIVYLREPGTSSAYAGYLDNVPGDTVNARFEEAAAFGLRVRNPTDSMELRWVVPTTGYTGITISYALQTSDSTIAGDAPHTEVFDYSTDGGSSWSTAGMTVNGVPATSLLASQPMYGGTGFGRVSIGFGSETSMNDNPNFVFRIKFVDSTHGTSGNNRFDNISVDAQQSLAGVNGPAPALASFAFPSPAQDYLSILCPVQGIKHLSITDITGRTIATFSENQEQYSYDVRALASGTYFIHIQSAGGAQATLRFVKE